MSYCVKPGCQNPQNQDDVKFCLYCGSNLLLEGRFRAIKSLHQGGFGKTFLAIDKHRLSKLCVIKQLYFRHDNEEYVEQATRLFSQEANHLYELGEHPQIPELLAYFDQSQPLYLVQEFIDGQTLEQELNKDGVYDESQIWKLLKDLLPVLQFVHDRNVIHRDIKPDNIMRRSHPQQQGVREGQLVLIDFGVAKLFTDSEYNRSGTVVGTQNYVAPEQITSGRAVPASDLYSLGATCIRLLTGVFPMNMYDFDRELHDWRRHLREGTAVSDDLGKILDKLLQRRISDRFKSANEVLQAIDFSPPLLPPLPPPPPPPPPDDKEEEVTKILPTLTSKVGVDYRNLDRLLSAQNWQEADRETWKGMCQALGKLPETPLQASDIDQFPCEDLQIIDRLWVKYSQDRFGFSIQKQIYESVSGMYVDFCNRVNWPSYNSNTYHQNLKFNLNAPKGHLPSRIWVAGEVLSRYADAMTSKLDKCSI